MSDFDNYAYRKQKMKEEGLLEIPMSIDSSRYFINNIRWADIVYTAPFIFLSIIIIYILYNTGNLSTSTATFSFLPPILVLLVFWVKHTDRKNISLYTIITWKIKYKLKKNQYELTKERKKEMKDDIRSQLGIYNIANDCYETLDNHLVKVIEVSSINLTGMSNNDRLKTLNAYQSFLNHLSVEMFPMQIEQFSRPINLKNYLQYIESENSDQKDFVKRMLTESYINKTNEIQKSKKMVSKGRYVILREKVGGDKNKSLDKINQKSEMLVSEITNMLSEKHRLNANILNNEELFDLIYSAIDYENAQISQSMRNENKKILTAITLGRSSYETLIDEIKKEKEFSIN